MIGDDYPLTQITVSSAACGYSKSQQDIGGAYVKSRIGGRVNPSVRHGDPPGVFVRILQVNTSLRVLRYSPRIFLMYKISSELVRKAGDKLPRRRYPFPTFKKPSYGIAVAALPKHP